MKNMSPKRNCDMLTTPTVSPCSRMQNCTPHLFSSFNETSSSSLSSTYHIELRSDTLYSTTKIDDSGHSFGFQWWGTFKSTNISAGELGFQLCSCNWGYYWCWFRLSISIECETSTSQTITSACVKTLFKKGFGEGLSNHEITFAFRLDKKFDDISVIWII